MNDRLFAFKADPNFVLRMAVPSSSEIRLGFLEGWIDECDVVHLELEKSKRGYKLTPGQEAVAYLLSDEVGRVRELLNGMDYRAEPSENPAELWLFLQISWVHDHETSYDDPLGALELIYADFDYPQEISKLIRFLPAQPGDGSIATEWARYIEQRKAFYALRSNSGRTV